MEEGGHYYTVYYTSLAVGFKKDIAYRHAVLSQMADEVGMLDAANLHKHECLRVLGPKFDLNDNLRFIDAAWRIKVEKYHSLVDKFARPELKSAAYQRAFTTNSLSKLNANSFEFGFLLHRLGDTYAHTKENSSEMYTISGAEYCSMNFSIEDNHGHGHHGSNPDYPVLRPQLFLSYLQNLYEVLHNKVQEKDSLDYRRNSTAKSAGEVSMAFIDIFLRYKVWVVEEERKLNQYYISYGNTKGSYKPLTLNIHEKLKWFISQIRSASERILQIKMESYQPENEENLTLAQFLKNHPELADLNINAKKIETAIDNSIPTEPEYYQNKYRPFENLKINPTTEMKNWITRGR
jgi:hypothetical protein